MGPDRKRAFTLVEIVIVMAILLVVAALAMPSLLRPRLAANESTAVNGMRLIVAGCQGYHASADPHTYPEGLIDLASPNSDPPYIDSLLAGATSTASPKQGYYYTYVLVNSARFTLNADPAVPNVTGARYFYADESGVIRFNATGPAGSSDPPIQ